MGEQAANTNQLGEPKERTHGNAQKFSYTLLRVLPPMELSRFRPQSSKDINYYEKKMNLGLGGYLKMLRKKYMDQTGY
jgi:hypothetical protein